MANWGKLLPIRRAAEHALKSGALLRESMHPLLAFFLRTIGIAVGGAVAIVGIPGGMFIFLAAGFGHAMCGNSPLSVTASPSGEFKAVVFTRDCGATTGFTTHVSIIDSKSALPDKVGNIFGADMEHDRTPVSSGSGPEIRVTWLGNQHLRLEHHQTVQVFKAERYEDGVRVDYLVH